MSDLSNLECDLVAATIKEMLRHRPIERTDDAIWRSAIRFGLVKASIANETMLAGGEATAWCDGAHVAAFGGPPQPVPPQNIEVSMGGFSLVERFENSVVHSETECDPRSSIETIKERNAARDALLAHYAAVEQLAVFGAKVLMQHHGDGERGDVDGGWLQETAVESGVMTTETKTVPCGEHCPCGDFVSHGETTECVPISNFALVRQLAATRPTEARDS